MQCCTQSLSCVLFFVTPWTVVCSSVHGILQARTLEWIDISSSRGSSRPSDRTQVSCISCIAGGFFSAGLPGSPSFTYTHTHMHPYKYKHTGLPGCASGEEYACQCRRHRRHGFDPWVGKILWRRNRLPTSVFLPGESQGYRNLVGYTHRIGKSQIWLRN